MPDTIQRTARPTRPDCPMKRLQPGQVLLPTEQLMDYRDFNQNGLRPGERKLQMFQTALRARGVPQLYAQDGQGEQAIVYVKIFDPCGSGTWWLFEWDGQEEAFGYVSGLGGCGASDGEYGYIPLRELAFVPGHFGIGLEIDTSFRPCRMGERKDRSGTVAE